jgi:hypothetical protein
MHKTPSLPLWIVRFETHFAVLFSLTKSAVLSAQKHSFTLYFYDALDSKQKEPYEATFGPTVENTTPSVRKKGAAQLSNPVEQIVATKWKVSTVEWQGIVPEVLL